MISLATARSLKDAGLVWLPKQLDYFIIPDRGLDDHIFVISDVLVTLELLQAIEVVSFQGASEWALDYLVIAEAVWILREDQVRQALEAALIVYDDSGIKLFTTEAGYQCIIHYDETEYRFDAKEASEAYASALLHVLLSRKH